jgi:hypothetical protein
MSEPTDSSAQSGSNVSAVVSVLIVDHVAAGFPERVSSAEDAWRFTLEPQQHFTVNRVTECQDRQDGDVAGN